MTEVLVFDTGPLSHLAKENWLGVLRAILPPRTAVIPDTVVAELRTPEHQQFLKAVLDADWISQHTLTSAEELSAFALFAERLVVGNRNIGEAGVLAYAKVHGAIPVIDDGAGRRAAKDYGLQPRGTLSILCEAVRAEILTVTLVSRLADHLIIGDYRLPFKKGEFERWARGEGML